MNDWVIKSLAKYKVTNPKDWIRDNNKINFENQIILEFPEINASFHCMINSSNVEVLEEGIEIYFPNTFI